MSWSSLIELSGSKDGVDEDERTRSVAAAASVLGISERQACHNPGVRKFAVEVVRTHYADFGPTLATEALAERHAQNSDLMRDPEICFELGLYGGAHLVTFRWRNDYAGTEEWSRNIVADRYVHMFELHTQHQRFAEMWNRTLRQQGFAEAFDPQKHIRG